MCFSIVMRSTHLKFMISENKIWSLKVASRGNLVYEVMHTYLCHVGNVLDTRPFWRDK